MSALGHWLQRKFRHPRSKHPKEEDPGIPHGLPILPNSYHNLCFDPLPSLSPFFQKLPSEIRRAIYLAAFGNRTFHMDLQYKHPDVSGPWHARLSGKDDAFDVSIPKAWLWWGSVCHRNLIIPDDLFFDNCRIGAGWCNYRRLDDGNWGHVDKTGPRDDCYVGVMGWMMSCRQAYTETVDILYSTNTIFIHSVPLNSYISSLLPLQNLARMTSLEFMWDINTFPDVLPWIRSEDREKVKLKRWKAYKNLMSMINKSTFQSLQKLVVVIVDYGDGGGWVPEEITKVSQTKPPQVIFLDPTDQLVEEFNGQLQKFELTLPIDRAKDLESKMGDFQVIEGGIGVARFRKFWRSLPERLPIHEGLGLSGEVGYWIIHGHPLRLSSTIPAHCTT